MKEITRIHIAKIAYEIEPEAKKELTGYISQLEKYAENKEVLQDIEIRITELLAEQGVVADGVITMDDVSSIRTKLGEPSDFALDGEDLEGVTSEENNSPKRVYRDVDDAILGGVCSGFAKYFGIDVVWARLIFIVLLFGSFGTALIIYLILWAIIPPATTAAEKLRMQGQPVTLESIKKLGDQVSSPDNKTVKVMKNIFMTGLGLTLVICTVGALLMTLLVGGGFFFGLGTSENSPFFGSEIEPHWTLSLAFIMFIISGLLLSALGFVLSNAVFRRQWNKRMLTSVVVIIVSGMVVFTTGVGVVTYGQWQQDVKYNSLRSTSKYNLPSGFNDIKNLTVDTDNGAYGEVVVEYTVSDKNSYEVESMPGFKPVISISEDGSTAVISSVNNNRKINSRYGSSTTFLKIYGPALENIDLKNGNIRYYNSARQENLHINAQGGTLGLSGTYENVSAAVSNHSGVDLENSAIQNLNAKIDSGQVKAGVVYELIVTQPTACTANSGNGNVGGSLSAQAVSNGFITHNGVRKPVQNVRENCGEVIIGDYLEG